VQHRVLSAAMSSIPACSSPQQTLAEASNSLQGVSTASLGLVAGLAAPDADNHPLHGVLRAIRQGLGQNRAGEPAGHSISTWLQGQVGCVNRQWPSI
jgi:hypothetical protein